MQLQIAVLDEIKTGMVTIPNVTFYSELNNNKFFYHKRKVFEVRRDINNPVDKNAILFLFDNIPIGYMIAEHASAYARHIQLWELIKASRPDFKFYAVMDDSAQMGEYEFNLYGTKKFSRICYPITIITKKS